LPICGREDGALTILSGSAARRGLSSTRIRVSASALIATRCTPEVRLQKHGVAKRRSEDRLAGEPPCIRAPYRGTPGMDARRPAETVSAGLRLCKRVAARPRRAGWSARPASLLDPHHDHAGHVVRVARERRHVIAAYHGGRCCRQPYWRLHTARVSPARFEHTMTPMTPTVQRSDRMERHVNRLAEHPCWISMRMSQIGGH
jgi:hypothetical protein